MLHVYIENKSEKPFNVEVTHSRAGIDEGAIVILRPGESSEFTLERNMALRVMEEDKLIQDWLESIPMDMI